MSSISESESMISYYLKFWGIDQPVFNRYLSPGDCFIAQRHQKMHDYLQILAQQAYTIQMITAPDGYGKSTLIRWLQSELSPQTTECYSINIEKKETASGWLLPHLARFLSGDSKSGESPSRHLSRGLDQLKHEKRSLLVMVDSGDLLSGPNAFAEMTYLHNLGFLAGVPVNLVLAGNSTMVQSLSQIPFFSEKSSLHWTLSPLSRKESVLYLRWYFYQARINQNPFPPQSMDSLHLHSAGVPSRLNSLAENCLIAAALRKRKVMTPEMVEQAVRMIKNSDKSNSYDLKNQTPHPPPAPKMRPPMAHAGVHPGKPVQEPQDEESSEPGISLFDDP